MALVRDSVGCLHLLREYVLGLHWTWLPNSKRLFRCEPQLLGSASLRTRFHRHRNILQQIAIHTPPLHPHTPLLRALAHLLDHPLLDHWSMVLSQKPVTWTIILCHHLLAWLDLPQRRSILLWHGPRMGHCTHLPFKAFASCRIYNNVQQIKAKQRPEPSLKQRGTRNRNRHESLSRLCLSIATTR